jgi:RNA polymerase sigma-70 factor (ECF subfamily)
MEEAAQSGGAGLEAEEARLARAAAAGDGDAFATLYERYARRAFNLAHRVCGSEEDAAEAVQDAFLNVIKRVPELGERELSFGSYLFAATRNATYDLIRRQQRSRPSDSIPDSAVPLGAGAGGLGLDPGDPDEDPERRTLLSAQREEIEEANARLPERQREALALRELEEMSYDEIAAVMEMNRNSVAQLISRARINLRDELRQTMLASIAAASPDCERALPLVAMRDDGQLDSDSEDAAWLAAHLGGCETCGLATAAMQEAGASYRLWLPLPLTPLLFRETMARAAELSGADWSAVTERHLARPADPARLPGMPAAYRVARRRRGPGSSGAPRRRLLVAAAAALLLLALGAASVTAIGGGESEPAVPPSPTVGIDAAVPLTEPSPGRAEQRTEQKAGGSSLATEPAPSAAPVTEPAAAPVPATEATGTESDSPDQPRNGAGGGDLDGKAPVTPKPDSETAPEPEPEPETTTPPPTPPTEEPEPTPEEPNPPPPSGPGGFKGNGGGGPAF